MPRRLFIAGVLAIASLAIFQAPASSAPQPVPALRATDYIRTLQNPDGGFPDFGTSSTTGGTLDAVLALASVNIDATTVQNSGNGPDAFLATQAAAYITQPGQAAKLAAVLAAMDLDPSNFASLDISATVDGYYNAGTGQFGFDSFAQSFYILSKIAVGDPVPPLAVTFLRSMQLPSGAWEYCCGFGADTNSTAIALRALLAAGVATSDTDVAEGIVYLHGTQNADGGFPYSTPFDSEANSTGFVMQAIVALGEETGPGGPWDLGGDNNPQDYLLSQQNPTSGALQYFGFDNAFATYQGVPGLIEAPYAEFLDLPPPDGDSDGFADSPATLHAGPANSVSTVDNCISLPNSTQVNSDGNYADNTPQVVHDATDPNSDRFGDACDADDDNDGLSDDAEATGSSCGAVVSDPLKLDTDGDGFHDGAECSLGTNPASSASDPGNSPNTVAGCGQPGDADGDRLSDRVEACGHNTDPADADTDGDRASDGAADGCEAASLTGDRVVNSTDQLLLALEYVRTLQGGILVGNFDLNKDGNLNSADQLAMAFLIQPGGQCP